MPATNSRNSHLELIIAVTALLFSIVTFGLGECRENKKNKSERELYDNYRRVTTKKLDDYNLLIHQKRNVDFFVLYDTLNSLITDSSEFIDILFKNIITNHLAKLQLWASRNGNSDIFYKSEKYKEESTNLVSENSNLYNSLCTKYRLQFNVNFFKDTYLF